MEDKKQYIYCARYGKELNELTIDELRQSVKDLVEESDSLRKQLARQYGATHSMMKLANKLKFEKC